MNGHVIIYSSTAAFIFNTLPALFQSLKCIPTAPAALPKVTLCHQYRLDAGLWARGGSGQEGGDLARHPMRQDNSQKCFCSHVGTTEYVW